jgi:hypothetical protein
MGVTGCDKVAVMTFGERLSWVPSKLTESIRPPAEGDLRVSTLKPMFALGWVLKGFRKPVTVNVKVVPVGHSGLVLHAFERVTVLTSVGSVEIDVDVHGAVVVPILHVMGFVPSKYTVSVGKVTLTPEP